jgi:hypothetical protein
MYYSPHYFFTLKDEYQLNNYDWSADKYFILPDQLMYSEIINYDFS